MLNRRLLRIKVLQIVYSHIFNNEKPLNESEKELLFSIEKSHELYLHFIGLLLDIAHQASLKAELIENREVTDRGEAIIYKRIAENKIITKLTADKEFARKYKKTGQSWNENLTLVKELLNITIESEFYKKYLQQQDTFSSDKICILAIVSEIFPLSENIFDFLEDKSIYWNDDIDFILEMVYKTIKNIEEKSTIEFFSSFSNETDKEFVINLFRKSVLNLNKYTDKIEKQLDNWKLDRVADIDLILIKLAIIEAIEFPSIPLKVTLNEYIEIAKFYSTENSGTFINGIIDKLFKQLVKEKIIIKSGRGLIE